MRPEEIERASMEIISRELNRGDIPAERLGIVLRVIHATADFDFADTLVFSETAVAQGKAALLRGVAVITDTRMAASGVNARCVEGRGGVLRCYMADDDVAEEAKSRGVTRALVAMEHAVAEHPEAVFAVGNAPTALIRLCELIREGRARPSLVVGVPVGFVNVVESKETLLETDVPYIVARGRKGGSPVAAAILNALLYAL